MPAKSSKNSASRFASFNAFVLCFFIAPLVAKERFSLSQSDIQFGQFNKVADLLFILRDTHMSEEVDDDDHGQDKFKSICMKVLLKDLEKQAEEEQLKLQVGL